MTKAEFIEKLITAASDIALFELLTEETRVKINASLRDVFHTYMDDAGIEKFGLNVVLENEEIQARMIFKLYDDEKTYRRVIVFNNEEISWKKYDEQEIASMDLVKHLHRAKNFSLNTYGPGIRTKGVIDHIKKELKEIEEHPLDLKEWIDVVILGFDGAWRAGYTPEEIVAALEAKQTKNENRKWPDWRTADPNKAIEHVRGIND